MCNHVPRNEEGRTLTDLRTRREFIQRTALAGVGAAVVPSLFPSRASAAMAVPFRRTTGIVTNQNTSNPAVEADVIMTAVTLGLATSYIQGGHGEMQFDMEKESKTTDQDIARFAAIVRSMNLAVGSYLAKQGLVKIPDVTAGISPGYEPGAVIMGVYKVAGQRPPTQLQKPTLSPKGKLLWEKIHRLQFPKGTIYTGRGAYTGFVDNNNTEGDTDPVGPMSTVRTTVQTWFDPAPIKAPFPRWLPPASSPLWAARQRSNKSLVPWGLIMKKPDFDPRWTSAQVQAAAQKAVDDTDQFTAAMKTSGMKFATMISTDDVAQYSHGLPLAIYKAYHLGPSCQPYEIAVGDETTKMASCLPCTLFMYSVGYPPTSIHLGAGESWAPLYQPYNQDPASTTGTMPSDPREIVTMRDLNYKWAKQCTEWINLGLKVMDDDHTKTDHRTSRDDVKRFMANNANPTLGGTLVLDAVTIHDKEAARIARTLV